MARLGELAATGTLEVFCADRRIRLMTAFGSAARGDAAARDLDIAVSYEPGGGEDHYKVASDLMRLLGTPDIDLVDLDNAGIILRDEALSGAKLLVERSEGLYADMQIAASLERMDTAWLRQLHLELMAKP
ncbi:MAG TPA: nucleotidyltransferase domain-containing protein [Coriobacteriia bacterium]|nr:nucleotidyltransferase domain-containing protein [Coriobacteriia bacterium]